MKKLLFRILMLPLLFCSFLMNGQKEPASAVIENVDAKTFSEMLAKNKATPIDLRTPAESEKGFIKGSAFIDFTDKNYEQEFARLDKSKPVYIYCAGGGRSAGAAEYMQEHGFKKVVNLTKGFNDWKKHGLPVELKGN